MKKTPLETLIDFPEDGTSAERRELMRLCTDRLLAAADRYGIREMEFFDLLYSNTARQMESHVRKLVAATLTRAGLSKEQISALVYEPPSMLGQILRKSATQPLADLAGNLREVTRINFGSDAMINPAPEILLPEHRFTLPRGLLREMFRFIVLAVAREAVTRNDGKLAPLVHHAMQQNGQKYMELSETEARDAILEARTAVTKKARGRKISEAYLAELLQTRHSLQFAFAMEIVLGVDTTTMLRILNDGTWDSLAIACRSARMSRNCFSAIINFMHRREDDHPAALRIMELYEKIPTASADRVMRFWQVRVSALRDSITAEDPAEVPVAANAEPATPTPEGSKSFGRR